MANLRGKWTVPGKPLPSSHLIVSTISGGDGLCAVRTRCGRTPSFGFGSPITDEPQSNVRVCERCSVLSNRDG